MFGERDLKLAIVTEVYSDEISKFINIFDAIINDSMYYVVREDVSTFEIQVIHNNEHLCYFWNIPDLTQINMSINDTFIKKCFGGGVDVRISSIIICLLDFKYDIKIDSIWHTSGKSDIHLTKTPNWIEIPKSKFFDALQQFK